MGITESTEKNFAAPKSSYADKLTLMGTLKTEDETVFTDGSEITNTIYKCY